MFSCWNYFDFHSPRSAAAFSALTKIHNVLDISKRQFSCWNYFDFHSPRSAAAFSALTKINDVFDKPKYKIRTPVNEFVIG